MIPAPRTIDDWTALLESRTPFTYANIGGDGEMLTVTGWKGTNSDGKKSTPEKQKALARCLTEPRYTFAGYNPGKKGTAKLQRAERWLRRHGINVPDRGRTTLDDPDYGSADINIRWVHKEIIGHANTTGRLGPFLRELLSRRWLAVGGEHLAGLHQALGVKQGSLPVFVGRTDQGWDEMPEIENWIRATLRRSAPDIVTFSLGYLTKVLIWRLAPDYPDVTMIDMGACFDPYCGVRNRSGYKRDTWPEMMRRNLETAVEAA